MKNKLGTLFALFSVPFVLFIIWLRPGLIIGGGESGIPFYHLYNTVGYISHAWSDGILGLPTSYSVGSLYFFRFLSLFQSLGVSGYLIQGILFAVLLLLSQVGIFVLVRKTIPSIKTWFFVPAVFFYVFNLISVVIVWNRLQYPFILFYSFLPFALFLVVKALEDKKLWYVIIINIGIILFSVAFTSIPILELLWIAFGFYFLFYIVTSANKKSAILFVILFFLTLLVVWALFNSWWILQFIKSFFSNSYTSQFAYNVGSDLGTFKTLSERLGNMAYVFRMMHKDFFTDINPLWKGAYSNPLVTIFTFFAPFLAFFPLTLKRKPKEIYFFLAFSIFALFMMKGAAGPFGEIFLFIFSHFRILETFRNPFEKFSLLLPLGYSPLIAYSLFVIYKSVSTKKKLFLPQLIFVGSIVVIIGLAFPLLNRWVFTSTFPPTSNLKIGYYTKVPEYYKQANNWLNQDKSDFRVIALPIDGEGMTYFWKYGYSGVELSNGLFDKPFISFTPTTQYIDTITHELQYSLFHRPQDISKIMSFLNAKYIMTRFDVDYKTRSMEDPQSIDGFLATESGKLIPHIFHIKDFGQLKFYQNDNELPVLYAASRYDITPSDLNFSDTLSFSQFQDREIIINPDLDSKTSSIIGNQNLMVLSPSSVIVINKASFPTVTLDDAKRQLFYPRTLPSSLMYPFIRFKENIESYAATTPSDTFFRYLLLSNKRLGEFVAEITLKSDKYSQSAYDEYIKSLYRLNEFRNTTVLNDNMYYFRSSIIAQKLILQDLSNNSHLEFKNKVNSALEKISQFSLQNSIDPLYNSVTIPGSQEADKVIYNFTVPSDGLYEMLLKSDGTEVVGNGLLQLIQVDKDLIQTSVTKTNDWMSYGKVNLKKGIHELQIPIASSSNLLVNKSEASFTISSGSSLPAVTKIPLHVLDPFATYRATFDFWVQRGNVAEVGVGDDVQNENQLGSYKEFGADGYNNYFQTRSFEFTLNPSAKNYYIAFSAKPYNDCIIVNSVNLFAKSQCDTDKSYYNKFGKPTTLEIKNLKFERVFTANQMLLKQENTNSQKSALPEIRFHKQNQSRYTVDVKNATQPYFLVLSQSFDPLWKLSFSDTKKAVSSHFLANSYANAWYIDRPGTYEIAIEFIPEVYFTIGKIISLFSIGFSLVLIGVIWYKKRK